MIGTGEDRSSLGNYSCRATTNSGQRLPRQLVFPAKEYPREESGGQCENGVAPKEV
jgi:hypothetical protein